MVNCRAFAGWSVLAAHGWTEVAVSWSLGFREQADVQPSKSDGRNFGQGFGWRHHRRSIDRAEVSGIGDRTYWFCSWHGLENFCVDGR